MSSSCLRQPRWVLTFMMCALLVGSILLATSHALEVDPMYQPDVEKVMETIRNCERQFAIRDGCRKAKLLIPSSDPNNEDTVSEAAKQMAEESSTPAMKAKRLGKLGQCANAAKVAASDECHTVANVGIEVAKARSVAYSASEAKKQQQKQQKQQQQEEKQQYSNQAAATTSTTKTTAPAPAPAPAPTPAPAPASTSPAGPKQRIRPMSEEVIHDREDMKKDVVQRRSRLTVSANKRRARMEALTALSKEKKAPKLAKERRDAKARRNAMAKQLKERDAIAALELEASSNPRVVKRGRARAKALVKRVLDAKPKPFLRLTPSVFKKYFLSGPRYFSAVIILSSLDAYGSSCPVCHQIHDLFQETATIVSAAQSDLLNRTATLPATPEESPLPAMLSTGDAKNYPTLFFLVDSMDYPSLFDANRIHNVPLIVGLPPTWKVEGAELNQWLASIPMNHRHRVTVRSDLQVSAILGLTNKVSRGDFQQNQVPDANNTKEQVINRLRNLSLTEAVVLTAVVLTLLAFVLSYFVSHILPIIRKLKPLVFVAALLGYAFNVTGGMFNRLAGSDFAPHHISNPKATWSELFHAAMTPHTWAQHGFRNQYTVEGLALALHYLCLCVALLFLVEFAFRRISPEETAKKPSLASRAVFLASWLVLGLAIPALVLYGMYVEWKVVSKSFERKAGHGDANLVEDLWKFYSWVQNLIKGNGRR